MIEQKVAGRVALITGGSSGIGLATAQLLQAQGAHVVIVGRSEKTLAAAQQQLGGTAVTIAADVAVPADLDRVMAEIKARFGQLDILFANAGISECPPIAETNETFFDELMGINVKGVFFAFTKALPLLSQDASVIFTSSVSHDRGRPGDPLYAASKAAVRSLARGLAADEDVLARGIRVNVVSPGAIQTLLTAQDTPELTAAIDAYIAQAVPMKRWGRAEEVARAVLFLACADSSYLTGGEIAVDGGLGQI